MTLLLLISVCLVLTGTTHALAHRGMPGTVTVATGTALLGAAGLVACHVARLL